MLNILIANRGLSAMKFILSINNCVYRKKLKLFGLVTEDDLKSDYQYISYLDDKIFCKNTIFTDIDEIIDICQKHSIDAVFPGWGYLSERADFVEQLEKNNIIFMGPSSETILQLGNKINSMKLAEDNNVPLVKWSGLKPLNNLNKVIDSVNKIGLPCILKEANGGGGKGIRVINTFDCKVIEENYNQIIKEMNLDKSNLSIFVMELMEECHHIEVQLLGDGEKTIHLFGRDCTLQRRNQKLVEEGPISVAPKHIIKLCEVSAIKMAESVNYKGLGTAEFLYSIKTNIVTFLEINPRLQVEHIVTELLLDINLPSILYQITCENKKISQIFNSFNKNTQTFFDYPKNHVIAARINAENVSGDFKPSSGKINSITIPNLLDTWSYISINNNGHIINTVDSQIGHIFSIGKTRNEAIQKMVYLIEKIKIDSNVNTSLFFIKKLLNDSIFINNLHTTKWIKYDMYDNIINRYINKNELDNYYWIFGLITQGWYRYCNYIDINNKLIENGHIVESDNTINLDINFKNYNNYINIKGNFNYRSLDNNWNSVVISIHDNDNENNDIYIETKLYIVSKSVLNIMLNNNIYRIQIITDDFPKYQDFKLFINDNIYQFYKKIDDNILLSPVSGKIVNIYIKSSYNLNDTIFEIESMKMIFPITCQNLSEFIISDINIGDLVKEGTILGKFKSDKSDISGNSGSYKNILKNIPKNMIINKTEFIECLENKTIKSDNHTNDNFDLINFLNYFEFKNISVIAIDKPIITKKWDYEQYENISYELLFDLDNRKTGVLGLLLVLNNDFKIVIICHHHSYNKSAFSIKEQKSFKTASQFCRENNIPRIYLCKTTGAYINYNTKILDDLIYKENLFFIKKIDYKKWEKEIVIDKNYNNNDNYKITHFKNHSIETLDGCADIASETSLAYNSIFTLTYIYGYSVGIGAYLSRLGHRIIQKKTHSPLLLTGYKPLNKVLGRHIYDSNNQLGGHHIMEANGVSQNSVETNKQGAELINLWLSFLQNSPIKKHLNCHLTCASKLTDFENIVDNGLIFETMESYSKSLITGRCKINNIAFAFIGNSKNITETKIPANYEDLNSSQNIRKKSPNVLYPDSSYKFAQTINDANRENIPLILWMNWRGFSGGQFDMFSEILKYGSMIVDNLREYKNPIYAYLPPNSQLRGGAMVVMSSGINKNIKMWADPTAKIGILEPEATFEVKYKKYQKKLKKEQLINLIEHYDKPDNNIVKTIKLENLREEIIRDINTKKSTLEQLYNSSNYSELLEKHYTNNQSENNLNLIA